MLDWVEGARLVTVMNVRASGVHDERGEQAALPQVGRCGEGVEGSHQGYSSLVSAEGRGVSDWSQRSGAWHERQESRISCSGRIGMIVISTSRPLKMTGTVMASPPQVDSLPGDGCRTSRRPYVSITNRVSSTICQQTAVSIVPPHGSASTVLYSYTMIGMSRGWSASGSGGTLLQPNARAMTQSNRRMAVLSPPRAVSQ